MNSKDMTENTIAQHIVLNAAVFVMLYNAPKEDRVIIHSVFGLFSCYMLYATYFR